MYDSAKPYKPLTAYTIFQQYDRDHIENVSESDLSLIRSRSRSLYANTPAIKNAISEQADYAVGDAWLLKSLSTDAEYVKSVEDYINNRWIPLSNLHEQLRLIVKSVLRDGDILLVLSKSSDGTWPVVQFIPAHKIRNGNTKFGVVDGGIYDGYTIENGCILNENGVPIAYNLVNADMPDTQISILNCKLVMEGDYIDQIRGEPALKDCINLWVDINTVNNFELQGIKTASSKALIINAPANQVAGLSGEDDDSPLISVTETTTASGGTTEVKSQTLRGGEVIVFDNSQGNGEMKQVDTNRPSQNVQSYLENLVRHAMLSLRWPMEFSVNLDMGGATAKTIFEKVRKRVEEIQQMIVLPVWKRIMVYVISVAAKNGYIKSHKDWLMFEPTYPRLPGYDQLKDTRSNIELYKLGILTATQLASAEGYDYQANIDEKISELLYVNEQSKLNNVNPNQVVQSTPNGNAPDQPVK